METLASAVEYAKTLNQPTMIGCNQDTGKYEVVLGKLDFCVARENKIIVDCTCEAGELNYVNL